LYEQLCQDSVAAVARKDYALAQQKAEEAIKVDPNRNEAYYNLFTLQFHRGHYDDAVRNYSKAVELGFVVPQEVQMIMEGYKYQEFTISLPGNEALSFKGSTGCSRKLTLDIMNEFVKAIDKAENITIVRPKFLKWDNGYKNWQEEWVVETKFDKKVLGITFTPSPGGGTDFEIRLQPSSL
jgi:lipopolysaccharide biosynthesis regulator YciM